MSEMIQKNEKFVFWRGDGKIIPHQLYEFYKLNGIGKYFPDEMNWKNADPLIVKIKDNIVSEINVGYLIELAKNHIEKCTEEDGESGPILDSLHNSTSLFGEKNLKMLTSLKLEFISDTRNAGYFFFRNGVVEVTASEIKIHHYDEFDKCVWEKSIVDADFTPVDIRELESRSVFFQFISDLAVMKDKEQSTARFEAIKSAIGYLLHRYKDGNTNQAIILMDVFVDGQPNGGSGKSLLINSIGKLRRLAIIDGKKYDQRMWYALSSVGIDSSILLFDDVERNFDFEKIFPLLSAGMQLCRKYKDNIFIPHENAPKIAITTNYALIGESSSHQRRKFEFEVSATYSAAFSPRDKSGKNFFDEWSPDEWNLFCSTMIQCLMVYLKNGLVTSEPISIKLNKLVNQTSEEFVNFSDTKLEIKKQLDKRAVYQQFTKEYPEFQYQVKQGEFTRWLKAWGAYKGYQIAESHSGDVNYIIFSNNITP